MKDPERLLTSTGDDFERDLLGSLRGAAPPAGAKDEAWQKIGSQIAAVAMIGSTVGSVPPNAGGTGLVTALAKASVTKIALAIAATAVVLGGGVVVARHRASPPPVSITTSVGPAADRAAALEPASRAHGSSRGRRIAEPGSVADSPRERRRDRQRSTRRRERPADGGAGGARQRRPESGAIDPDTHADRVPSWRALAGARGPRHRGARGGRQGGRCSAKSARVHRRPPREPAQRPARALRRRAVIIGRLVPAVGHVRAGRDADRDHLVPGHRRFGRLVDTRSVPGGRERRALLRVRRR